MEKRNDSLPIFDQMRPPRTGRRDQTGISKPIRLLAATTMALFVFLLIHIMRKPSTIQRQGSDDGKMAEMIRDPNLDGKQLACTL